jgi:hypothetical protein
MYKSLHFNACHNKTAIKTIHRTNKNCQETLPGNSTIDFLHRRRIREIHHGWNEEVFN